MLIYLFHTLPNRICCYREYFDMGIIRYHKEYVQSFQMEYVKLDDLLSYGKCYDYKYLIMENIL